jgi:hypothetical protein
MGQSIALHAAELAHFGNRKRLRMTVLDRETRGFEAFRARYPAFCRPDADLSGDVPDGWDEPRSTRPGIRFVCNAEFRELPADIEEPGFIGRLGKMLLRPGVRPTLFVGFDDEDANFETAMRVMHKLRDGLEEEDRARLKAHVWLPAHAGFAALLPKAGFAAFGEQDVVCTLEEVRNRLLLDLARGLHEEFRRDNQELRIGPWEELDDVLRMSNVWAATHIDVKLRDMGYEVRAKDEPGRPIEDFGDNVERMAEVEHNRWVAERLMAGKRHGKPEAGGHPLILPWGKLGKEQEKDREQVRSIPRRLAGLGKKVVLRGDTGSAPR